LPGEKRRILTGCTQDLFGSRDVYGRVLLLGRIDPGRKRIDGGFEIVQSVLLCDVVTGRQHEQRQRE
jgi:hypothetical protein